MQKTTSKSKNILKAQKKTESTKTVNSVFFVEKIKIKPSYRTLRQ